MDADRASALPLSAAQHGIWMGQKLAPGSSAYNVAECFDFEGDWDEDRLARAIEATLLEADALHVALREDGGRPLQASHEVRCANLRRIDLRAEGAASLALDAFVQADRVRTFAFEEGPLYRSALVRTGDHALCWYLAAHHVALDGYAFALLFERVCELYVAASLGRAPRPRWFGPLDQAVRDDALYRESEAYRQDAAFWRARCLAFGPAYTGVPAAPPTAVAPLRTRLHVGPEAREALSGLARAVGANFADALTALFAVHTRVSTGASDVVLGVARAAREGRAQWRLPCMCMNLIPLHLRVADADSPRALVAQAAHALASVRPHESYRYEQLRRDLGWVSGSRALFGRVLNLLPFRSAFAFGELKASARNVAAGPVEDLSLSVQPEADGGLSLTFDAHPARYTPGGLGRLSQELGHMLSDFCAAAEQPAARLWAAAPACEPSFEHEALSSVDDVMVAILRHAARDPDALALTQGDLWLSYGELCRAAGRVARSLHACEIGQGDLVAVFAPRSVDAIVAILGVLFAGAAYLPLDPDAPPVRNAGVLADARPRCVLVDDAHHEGLAQLAPGLFTLPLRAAPELEPFATELAPAATDLAYVIYTSGSTGQPNGVEVSRGALAHFVAAARARYAITARDRTLQFATLSFDASIEEVFVTLSAGASLAVRDAAMLHSMRGFLEGCAAREVTLLDLPTAFFHELSFALSTQALALPACVRLVIIGGEAASAERVRRFLRAAGPNVKLINTYGPTEATVVVCSAALSDPEALEVPIGWPLAGVHCAVIGPDGAQLPDGAAGELCVYGPTLALGYRAREALTAARFVRLSHVAGAPRAYRTGDRVRRRADGALLFEGRLDDQLKIAGHRVDPREVEAALCAHPAVEDAAVIALDAGAAAPGLCAFIVAPSALTAATLRAFLRQRLMPAAVPGRFSWVTRLPKTASGKIDRRALRAEAERAPSPAVSEAHDDEDSHTLGASLEALRAVLKQPDFGVDDDFFESGGHSLTALQAVNALSAQLGYEVAASLLFEHPTPRALSSALAGDRGRQDLALVAQDAALPLPAVHPAPFAGAGDALLTGATGFVGAHLVRELLAQTRGTVFCLVRAEDDAAARARLGESLARYGMTLAESEAKRLVAVAADLAKPRLGLSEARHEELARACDAVYHVGANVSLLRTYRSMRATNVLGTHALLNLACTGRPKRFHHVSTLAVCVGADARGTLREAPISMHDGLRDGYTQSKWAAEALVCAARRAGLEASIYRLGRVVGPTSSGFVNAEDIVWRLLRAGVALGALPEFSAAEPWTPVDFVARAIAQLSRSASLAPVYHVVKSELFALQRLPEALAAYGYALDRCDGARFLSLLRGSPDPEHRAVLAFMEAQSRADGSPLLRAVEREAFARDAGDAEGPAIDAALLHRYFGFCVQNGLFLAPPRA